MAKGKRKKQINVNDQIKSFILKRRKADNHVELQDVKDDLADWARANPDVLQPEEWASDRVDVYDRGRRPKSEEPGFFDGEGLIPVSYDVIEGTGRIVGTGERCRYKDAGRRELESWLAIETQQATDQMNAFNRRVQEINSWLVAFRRPEYAAFETVGELREAMTPRPNGGGKPGPQPNPPA